MTHIISLKVKLVISMSYFWLNRYNFYLENSPRHLYFCFNVILYLLYLIFETNRLILVTDGLIINWNWILMCILYVRRYLMHLIGLKMPTPVMSGYKKNFSKL